MNIKEIFHNRYELLRRVGHGGFSEVWEAFDIRSGLVIAIKIFRKQDEIGIKFCKEEYLKTYELKHPNILSPFHFDIADDRPYLVMKYLNGGTLAEKIGHLNKSEIQNLISQLSDALNYLHRLPEPLVHGDIKPDNILIDENGNFCLTDFGISTKLKQKFTQTLLADPLPQANAGVTPMAYRCPETFKYKDWQERPLNPKSDIWSAGITLYQSLYDSLPFNGEGGLGQLILMKSANCTIDQVLDFEDNDSLRLFEPVIMSALELYPEDRPSIFGQYSAYIYKIQVQSTQKPNNSKSEALIFVNDEKSKNKKDNKLTYFLLFAFVSTAVFAGILFSKKPKYIPIQSAATTNDSSINTNTQVNPVIYSSPVTIDNKPNPSVSNTTIVTDKNIQNISNQQNLLINKQTEIIQQKDENPVISIAKTETSTNPEPVAIVETAIDKPVKETIKEKTKTTNIKANIPVSLALYEDIDDVTKYPSGSKIQFIVETNVISYGDVILNKGQIVYGLVKKNDGKKLNIRFPEIYTSGGTKMKSLIKDNFDIVVGVDKKGEIYHPFTDFQTNVIIKYE